MGFPSRKNNKKYKIYVSQSFLVDDTDHNYLF